METINTETCHFKALYNYTDLRFTWWRSYCEESFYRRVLVLCLTRILPPLLGMEGTYRKFGNDNLQTIPCFNFLVNILEGRAAN